MKRNIELKAKVERLDRVEGAARRLGAKHAGMERQRDTYFSAPAGRLKLRERWSLDPVSLESAHTWPSQLIFYHRSNESHARPSDYLLVEVADGEPMRRLLDRSLGVIAQVLKVRSIFLFDNVRIHLDQVDELGTFLEFEAIVDSACDDQQAHGKLNHLRSVFEVSDAEVCSQSYGDLILQGNKRDGSIL